VFLKIQKRLTNVLGKSKKRNEMKSFEKLSIKFKNDF